MRVKKNTRFLLFRFGNYWDVDFIAEHKKIIIEQGYVWMLKTGKKVSLDKLNAILEDGGYVILKESKQAGNRYYLGTFTEVTLDNPEDARHCPDYYQNVKSYSQEWFKITSIGALDEANVETLLLSNSGKALKDVIDRTSSSFMFVENNMEWEVTINA